MKLLRPPGGDNLSLLEGGCEILDTYDAIVIGGGPAGSCSAAYLARAGMKCAVLESEKFPRPHVGESLVPAATPVFHDLGLMDKLHQAGFVKKFGAAWTSAYSGDKLNIEHGGFSARYYAETTIAEQSSRTKLPINYTFHVDRGKFDKLLLDHAGELGAEVREETSVMHVDFSEQPLVTVRYKNGKSEGRMKARVIVDASGRRTILGNQLRLKKTDEVFNQFALHTWFDGYERGTGPKDDYIYIHFLPVTNSWVWQIPITETVTSIGVVTQKENFVNARGSYDEFFWECIRSRPELHEKLQSSRQMRPLTREADYSYSMDNVCGDRFIMVGDAARFVDPIFSSGVSIAVTSARMASEAIQAAAEAGDFGAERFADYQRVMRLGCDKWYEFISLYYRLNILFTYFVNKPKYRVDVLRLLAGDVWTDEKMEVLDKMKSIVSTVENDPGHIWHNLLGTLTADQFKPRF